MRALLWVSPAEEGAGEVVAKEARARGPRKPAAPEVARKARAGPGRWLSGPGRVGEVLSVVTPRSAKASFFAPRTVSPALPLVGWLGRSCPWASTPPGPGWQGGVDPEA